MSVAPEYAPKLPNNYIREEHSYFVEIAFEGVFYGITVTIYVLTLHLLYRKSWIHKSWKLLTFLTIQHILTLIGVAGNIDLNMRSFVYNRNIPGGPVGYQQKYSNLPFSYAALVGFTSATWLQDGFLLHRAMVIWPDSQRKRKIFITPFAMYIISILASLILLFQISHPTSTFFAFIPKQIPIPMIFFCLSVGLNATLGGLIIYQLLKDRKELTATLGNYRTKLILNNVDIIIESGIVYSIVGTVLIISFRFDPAIATGIEGLYGPLTALTSHLIAYRMVKGTAWSRDTVQDVGHNYARILNKTQDSEIEANSGEGMRLLSPSERFALGEDE